MSVLRVLLISVLIALLWINTVAAEDVQLVPQGGVYTLPVRVNGSLIIPFVIDSGAADVSIPADVGSTLMRTGTITEDDFIGKASYTAATGEEFKSVEFLLREVKVGNHVLKNVVAGIVPAQGEPLLGQSFLSRLPTWTIDNGRHVLVLGDAAALPAPVNPVRLTGQLFPNSDRLPVAVQDLAVLSCDQLRLARNEIYARNGRFFQRADLQSYFGGFDWYKPSTWNPRLNTIEQANIQTMQQVEKNKACRP